MGSFYDIKVDRWREASQADIERFVRCGQAFGMLVTYLRGTQRIHDGVAADIAVEVTQGAREITEGARALRALLQAPD